MRDRNTLIAPLTLSLLANAVIGYRLSLGDMQVGDSLQIISQQAAQSLRTLSKLGTDEGGPPEFQALWSRTAFDRIEALSLRWRLRLSEP